MAKCLTDGKEPTSLHGHMAKIATLQRKKASERAREREGGGRKLLSSQKCFRSTEIRYKETGIIFPQLTPPPLLSLSLSLWRWFGGGDEYPYLHLGICFSHLYFLYSSHLGPRLNSSLSDGLSIPTSFSTVQSESRLQGGKKGGSEMNTADAWALLSMA